MKIRINIKKNNNIAVINNTLCSRMTPSEHIIKNDNQDKRSGKRGL